MERKTADSIAAPRRNFEADSAAQNGFLFFILLIILIIVVIIIMQQCINVLMPNTAGARRHTRAHSHLPHTPYKPWVRPKEINKNQGHAH